MAPDNDELNKRRREREAYRRRRQQAMYTRLALAIAVLIGCIVGIFIVIRNTEPVSAPAIATEAAPVIEIEEEETEAPTEKRASWDKAPVKIHVAAAGDLNITDKVIWSGQTSSDFNYTNAFMDVAPILSEADLTLMNFEGNVCGAPYGTETISAPQQLLEALKNAGVDVLQMANSCSIRNGLLGLTSTLANIRAAGLEPLGAYSSAEEYRKSKGYTICQVGDVKIALVAFTKGVGSLGLPVGSEDCVNILYEDYYTTYQTINRKRIREILRAAESEKPDLTIAMLHWGSEFNDTISDTQKSIVELMKKNGVDVILGSHSHMIHELSYDDTTGFFVAYSLGDFFGDGNRSGTNYSILLDLEITKNNDTGETKVTDYGFTPLYILSESEGPDGRQVVRINETMSAYDMNYIDRIAKSAYSGMSNALTRISNRVQGKYK